MKQYPADTPRFLPVTKTRQRGFSLIEIALVLVIVGLALGGIVAAIGPQLDNKNVRDTQERIKQASDAIMAFAMVNRRLPCPAAATSGGQEQWCTNALGACGAIITAPTAAPMHGRCANPNNGFVPARTLGLGDQGPNGVIQDAWTFGLRYGVSQTTYTGGGNAPHSIPCVGTCYPLTQLSGIPNAYYTNGAQTTVPPVGQVEVCASSTGITATTCGTAILLGQVAFVVWSTGRNGAAGGGVDELENLDADVVYVFHPRTEVGATNGEFDDIFQWQTINAVVGKMGDGGVLN
jgi:prepilin-type N-terminal cleavage/methylation domain-containing protein